jgi:putative flippase GtrA
MKFTDREFLRFLISGGLNTVLGYLLYCGLLLVLPYRAAYTASYILGVGIAYLTSSLFVFRSRPSIRTAVRFPLVYLAQYLLGVGLLTLLVDRLHHDPRIAAVAVLIFSLPVTFILSKFMLKQSSQEPGQPGA